MKRLKFSDNLVESILNGEKCVTWRINDEKNLLVDDIISCCRTDGKEFARARITFVKETIFEKLTNDDKEGHEKFSSDEEMYKTYSRYYKMQVVPKTKLKVIVFELLKN